MNKSIGSVLKRIEVEKMSKKNDLLSTLTLGWFVSQFWWVILFVIIAFVIILISETRDIGKEYQKYGYSGYWDNIKYDEWTGEIIPKAEIETYLK